MIHKEMVLPKSLSSEKMEPLFFLTNTVVKTDILCIHTVALYGDKWTFCGLNIVLLKVCIGNA